MIEEELASAKALLVIWSAEAVKSQWVKSEADCTRHDDKLVQMTVDGAQLPMPFDQTQCAELGGLDGGYGGARLEPCLDQRCRAGRRGHCDVIAGASRRRHSRSRPPP